MMLLMKALILLIFNVLRFVHGSEYVVYPVDRRSPTACARTTQFLNNILGVGNVQACFSDVRQVTNFWLVQADESQIGEIRAQPDVRAVLENIIVTKNDGETFGNTSVVEIPNGTWLNRSGTTNSTNESIVRQVNAPQDLDVVSWPDSKAMPRFGGMKGYAFDVTYGLDTYIYVIENGINPNNPDFRKTPIEWHFMPGAAKSEVDDDGAAHGSCVASKAVGWRNGVSKNSRLIIMKASHSVSDNNWAWAAALDDIIRKGRQGRAVVLYARSYTQLYTLESALPSDLTSVRELLYELIDESVVVVTSAGNDALKRSPKIDTVPAIWSPIMPILVVGAVTTGGQIAKFSQWINPDPVIWAPGDTVQCANGLSSSQTASGTSPAAAMVAGLAAYSMDAYERPPAGGQSQQMRRFIQYTSRPIYPAIAPSVIWNGLDGSRSPLLNISIA